MSIFAIQINRRLLPHNNTRPTIRRTQHVQVKNIHAIVLLNNDRTLFLYCVACEIFNAKFQCYYYECPPPLFAIRFTRMDQRGLPRRDDHIMLTLFHMS